MLSLRQSLLLFVAVSQVASASWMVRSPPNQKLPSYRHFQESINGQQQQVLDDKPLIVTITQHRTAYNIQYRTVTQTWTAPQPQPTSNLDSCDPKACESCSSWFRCDDTPTCFYCKTLPRDCNCVPPAELIHGANEYERHYQAAVDEDGLEEGHGGWQTCVHGSHQRPCFVEDQEILPRLDL